MFPRQLATFVLLVAVALLAGCFDDEGEDGAPTATATRATPAATAATATPIATVTSTATATEEPTPTPRATEERPQYGIWSVDAGSLEVAVLHESGSHANLTELSADGGVWLNYADERRSTRFGVDGSVLEQREGFYSGEPTSPLCEQDEFGDLAARVDGVEYEANCGWPFSRDGSKMLYTVEMGGGPGVPLAEYRRWVLDLDTGTSTEIDATLRHCGGCDGIAGPSWSPSGRYLLVGETYTGPDSSVYLYDSEARTTRLAARASGINGVSLVPTWGLDEDALLRPGSSGGTVYEQADGSGAVDLPEVPWPARVAGSPEWVVSLGRVPRGTDSVVVADVTSGELLARWPGRLSTLPLWFDGSLGWAVGAVDGQPVGLVEDGPACEGTVLHHPVRDDEGGVCLEGAQAAMLSPEASRVAFARQVAIVEFDAEWEIVIREAESGREEVLARTLFDFQPPLLRWTPDGDHLLVIWPRPGL